MRDSHVVAINYNTEAGKPVKEPPPGSGIRVSFTVVR